MKEGGLQNGRDGGKSSNTSTNKSRWRGAEQVLVMLKEGAQHVSIPLEMGDGGGEANVVPCSEVEAGAQHFWNRDFPVL